jgi:hypothetical protein
MANYKVIDDFLPEKEFLTIKDLLFSNNLPWFYYPNISFNEHSKNNLFYLVHIFYFNSRINSDFFDNIKIILDKINPQKLLRVKANMYPNQGIQDLNEMHVDYDYSHKGAIFSINTCNGGTILENGTRIPSLANRILFFDPGKPHDSYNCTDTKNRVNININYL